MSFSALSSTLACSPAAWLWRDDDEPAVEHVVASVAGENLHFHSYMRGAGYTVHSHLTYHESGDHQVAARIRTDDGGTRTLAMKVAGGVWSSTRDSETVWTGLPELAGAVAVDLEWTPLTNTCALWHLDLEVGNEKEIAVAWVRLPDLRIQREEQRYTRTGERMVTFESSDGFAADLDLDAADIVDRYGEIWYRSEMMSNVDNLSEP